MDSVIIIVGMDAVITAERLLLVQVVAMMCGIALDEMVVADQDDAVNQDQSMDDVVLVEIDAVRAVRLLLVQVVTIMYGIVVDETVVADQDDVK